MIVQIVALALTALLVPNAVLASDEDPPAPSLQERCNAFCGKVYAEGSTEEGQCIDGCREADACSRKCDIPFPEDKAKHAACLKHCMHKSARR